MKQPTAPASQAAPWYFDGFEALDFCHRETLRMLLQLQALVDRLEDIGPDDRARAMAADIECHFSHTVAAHHADEEHHVFPALALNGDAATQQTIARLKQDHAWMDANWRDLRPQLDAIACGQSWVDLDLLREGVNVLCALARDHIVLEESLVYPELKRRLSDVDRSRMNEEMQARRRVTRRALLPRRAGLRD